MYIPIIVIFAALVIEKLKFNRYIVPGFNFIVVVRKSL
ncbi:MAG: hypothetical protein Ct9H300mP4_14610 [Gammaproteobacteria bacterium]|nr:MAG: hypothetical protein Ct9H300mP4_14610 [Gammaproteobacteria bacterium]